MKHSAYIQESQHTITVSQYDADYNLVSKNRVIPVWYSVLMELAWKLTADSSVIQTTTNTVQYIYLLLHISFLVFSCVPCTSVVVAALLPDF